MFQSSVSFDHSVQIWSPIFKKPLSDRPTEPKITPYFKSDLLNCEASGNPTPRISWEWFPSDTPGRPHELRDSSKLKLPLDGKNYNYRYVFYKTRKFNGIYQSCVASNKHGKSKTMISSAQLAQRQEFLSKNLSIIVGAGIGSLIALLLIGFCVCYCTLRSNRKKYKR